MITIHGQTPSHKNSKLWTGRVLMNNKAYLAWRDDAELDVLGQMDKKYPDGVEVEMTFYVADRRRRDIDNMVASILDVLVSTGVITDDNCFVVRGIHAYYGGIDRQDPRAEVEICDLGEMSEQ